VISFRAAELLNAIPEAEVSLDDSQLSDASSGYASTVLAPNTDPDESVLEAKEISKYLLAKSLFDCREYDRCAAIFLPESTLTSIVAPKESNATPKGKGKGKAAAGTARPSNGQAIPKISQRSLFLALYAKLLSGEKRKDEDAEMVMGPQDLGTCKNKQLITVTRVLEAWFESRKTEDGEVMDGQGWLEYL
jgi:anaphase-promoting complex subunit 8